MTSKPKQQTLAVVMPAFMEEKEIFKSITRLLNVLDHLDLNSKIIVVVDGSTDNTEQQALLIQDPRVTVISYPTNMGKGFAIKTGCTEVISFADYVCFADADLDLNPSGIPTLLAILEMDHADAVVGSKIHPNSIVDYPRTRRIQSSVFRLIARKLFDLDVADTQTGLKVFKRQLLETCIKNVDSNGFAFDLELLALARLNGFKIVEGPVELSFNFTSTTGLRAVIQVLRDVLRIKLKVRKQK